MEKAILNVKTTKKGKVISELHFTDLGKTMPFPQFDKKHAKLNGAEVEVERIEGKIVRVQAGDTLVYLGIAPKPTSQQTFQKPSSTRPVRSQPAKRVDEGPMQMKQVKQIRYPAYAPYNFIPLCNPKVVEIPDGIPDFNTYHDDRNTGWIEVEIETKTPLYTRDTTTPEEERSETINSDFYSPGGVPRIPGSSLRGMIRTLVEIVSFSKFVTYTDRLLYYRGLADKSNLRKEYQDHMSSYDRKARKANYKMSAGFLRRKPNSFDYEIIPVEGFGQIPKSKAREKVRRLPGREYREFEFYHIDEGCLVVSGDMKNKKKDWVLSDRELEKEIVPIPEEDIENYHNDSTRSDKVPDLIHLADRMAAKPAKEQEKIPCFYVRWEDALGNLRVSFGHTAMFRLAYEKNIGEHIPLDAYKITERALQELKRKNLEPKVLEKLKALTGQPFTKYGFAAKLTQADITRKKERDLIMAYTGIIDFAEAIFGNEKTFAGRVFFEDAVLQDGQNPEEVLMAEGTPKILSTPKPTTFQHYLAQSSDNIRQLNHYNSNAAIRGNKLYWHKSGKHWQETDQEAIKKHHTQYTKIRPVKPQTTFVGRIRFENLSDRELGALLFALDLPKGCFHKLGMGKPLGLGSIHIRPRLYLSNRKERYTSLFAEVALPESEAIAELKQKFEVHICEALNENNVRSLWELERLKELRAMLDFEKGNSLERQGKIRYMEIERQTGAKKENEFKNRQVLPLPTQIK